MRIRILRHVPLEEPAAIDDWAGQRGHALEVVRRDPGEPTPDAEHTAGRVVMGGPMSLNNMDRYDWIEPARRSIRAMIDAGRPVLGICLGARALAAAGGARMYRGAEKEIGWFPVRRVTDRGLGRHLPATFTPPHWHGETFHLPDGATRLAEADAANQAVQIDSHVLGLRHLSRLPLGQSTRPAVVTHQVTRSRHLVEGDKRLSSKSSAV